MQGQLQWHIINESLIQMLQQFLCLKWHIFLDSPQVLILVKLPIVTLLLHLTRGQVWNRREAMLSEDLFHVLVA